MKKREKEVLDEYTKNLEEEIQPAELPDMIGPEKEILKKKEKPPSRKNAKKLRLA